MTGRGGIEINIGPGQFVFGRDSASLELDMNPSTIWKRMGKLKNLQNLTIESSRQYSLITILNWHTYQEEKLESNNESNYQVTGKEQASDTNKKDKKEKNKIIKELYLDFVMLSKNEHENLIIELGEPATKDMLSRLNNYLGSTGKKYKSHYFTILNWNRKDKENGISKHTGSKSTKYAHLGTTFNLDSTGIQPEGGSREKIS
jgi:hypothetical protein